MNPDEIIKAAPEIAKIVAPVAAAIPFTGIVKRMLGPAADELAEMWKDQIRLYRYERQVKCVKKAESMARDAGFTPQAVPPKILFPLLEGASFEDNEELHTMWAALLANAASHEKARTVRPSFISTLHSMRPDEAVLLAWFYRTLFERGGVHPEGLEKGALTFDLAELLDAFRLLGLADQLNDLEQPVEFPTQLSSVTTADSTHCIGCLDSLKAQGLIHQLDSVSLLSPYTKGGTYCGTYRGYEFFAACSPPKLKKTGK
jgi:hypothetical protein